MNDDDKVRFDLRDDRPWHARIGWAAALIGSLLSLYALRYVLGFVAVVIGTYGLAAWFGVELIAVEDLLPAEAEERALLDDVVAWILSALGLWQASP